MWNARISAAITALALAQSPGFVEEKGLARAVGLVIEKPEHVTGLLTRADQRSGLLVQSGDLLFQGDRLVAFGSGLRYVSCSADGVGEVLEMTPGSSAPSKVIEAIPCRLPSVSNPSPASYQDGGDLGGYQREPEEADELERSLQSLDEKQRTVVRGELNQFDQILKRERDSLVALVARAAVLDDNKLQSEAVRAYEAIAGRLGYRPAWLLSRVWENRRRLGEKRAGGAEARTPPVRTGRTFAVVVGISEYDDPTIADLRYAHCDAISFEKFLRSERGGAVDANNIALLVNDGATREAIRCALERKLGRAGEGDKVILYLSGHGFLQRCDKVQPRAKDVAPAHADQTAGEKRCYYNRGEGEGYILTHDTLADGADIRTTAFSMEDLQRLVAESFGSVNEVQLFADVCRAGATVGGVQAQAFDASGQMVWNPAKKKLLRFFSSNNQQSSWEGKEYGGGHGAFTYFLLEALNGRNDNDRFNKNFELQAWRVANLVHERILDTNTPPQAPTAAGITELGVGRTHRKAGENLPPFELGDYPFNGPLLPGACQPPPGATHSTRGWRGVIPGFPATPESIEGFQQLLHQIQAGLSPDAAARRMRSIRDQAAGQLAPESFQELADSWRVELGDLAQQVMIEYLKGEQAPQTRASFVRGAAYLEALQVLTPESLWNQARLEFFRGRITIFDRSYEQARLLLETSVRLDPTRAYAFNALGIAYLEQARFNEAKAAFQDAIARAPRWAYAHHNLALAHQQTGGYAEAIVGYRHAMEVAPQYGYLPYNLGLLYLKMNQPSRARQLLEEALAKAASMEPEEHRRRHVALAHNALGYLMARSEPDKAEQSYRRALEQASGRPALLRTDAVFIEVRHNLASLHADVRGNRDQAVREWQEILTDKPDYLPSRVSLAQVLETGGRIDEAIEQYDELIRREPEYVAAYLAASNLHLRQGRTHAAMERLQGALALQPQSPIIHEKLAEAYTAANDPIGARAAYEKALGLSKDGGARRRVRKALEKLPAKVRTEGT